MEYGVQYRQVGLLPDGTFDFDGIRAAIGPKTKLITIQRSKGYATRPSFSVAQIGELIAFCKQCRPDVLCMVDNCYGEFVERVEPSDVGRGHDRRQPDQKPRRRTGPPSAAISAARRNASSAAPTVSAPGLGQEVGANLGLLPSLYEGLLPLPRTSFPGRSGARFLPRMCMSGWASASCRTGRNRGTISFRPSSLARRRGMLAFCRGIQAAAPVDSYVTPVPWAMPGYDAEVVMAAGAFVQGSSIELSADGPIREPYAVYFQGGLTWHHAKSRHSDEPAEARGRGPCEAAGIKRKAKPYAPAYLNVGADAHIGPLESCEFAVDSRKNGAICRADVGIGPYTR